MRQSIIFVCFLGMLIRSTYGVIPRNTWHVISEINKGGPFLGIVVPNAFEMSPLLQSSDFVPNSKLSYLDFEGRRFRFGTIANQKAIMVMTGLGMLNAGLTTQLLITLFNINGVVHFGIAGNANPNLGIGDVTIPQFWVHTGLWYWQRNGQGPDHQLSLEENGDYTREYGYLNFSDYSSNGPKSNELNSVWYEPEEVFPVFGVPEQRQHKFFVSVDKKYYQLSKKLEGLELAQCINSTTCLERKPKVVRVSNGCSANTFVDNAAYRTFIRSKFDVTPVDMESASVALVCYEQNVPFIAFRSLSDLAGGGSAQSNEADLFGGLAADNAVGVALKFISLLGEGKTFSM